MTKTLEKIKASVLGFGENFRFHNGYKTEGLRSDIAERGLQESLMVWDKGEDKMEILRGNRRGKSILELKEISPAQFDKWFADGVDCIVVRDVTPDEALILKVDEGTKLTLNNPYEVQLAANMLFQAGFKEADVAITLADLIDRVSPMSAEVSRELSALRIKRDEAATRGLTDYVKTVDAEIRKLFGTYRHGFCQGLNNTYRCPTKVHYAKYFHACGERHPEDKSTDFLPKLTTASITKLWKAHTKDLEIIEIGQMVSKYNKRVTGPNFNSEWSKLVVKQQEADGKDKPTNPKAMSAKDIMLEVTGGKFKSDAVQLACKWHAGDKEVIGDLTKADEYAYLAALVREGDKDLWKKVVKVATTLEAKMAAEAVEATVQD